MPYEFDVYFAHATEDKPELEQYVRVLENEGLRVWYDDDQIESGLSLREQLDAGMKKSAIGVVVLSQAFFAPTKRWAPAEFNSWLETGPTDRLVVLWHTVEHAQVAEWSPIAGTLVGRSTSRSSFMNQVLSDVFKKLVRLGSYATRLRVNLGRNLEWVRPPQFFYSALQSIDRDQTWSELAPPAPPDAIPVSLPELIESPTDYVDHQVMVNGHQVFQQLLERAAPPDHQEFAVQLMSRTEGYERCLVMAVFAKTSEEPLPMPTPAGEGWQAFALGTPIARGAWKAGSEVWQVVVLMARDLFYVVLEDENGDPGVKRWPGDF